MSLTVITDLPRATLMQRSDVSAHLDALIIVIPAGFSGVNAASRLIERISAQAPDLTILPVLSDLRRDAKLSAKDVTSTIGRALVATLPRSDAPLMRAHRAARPIVQTQPRGAYAKAVQTIWDVALKTVTTPDAPAPKPLLKRMFG